MAIDIVAATTNTNKIAELSSVAKEFGLTVLAPADIQKLRGLGPIPKFEEDADTYLGNARIKARAFVEWASMPALGDDSGLEVAALDGRPGLYSARYGGPGATDDQKIDKLLNELAALGPGVDRTAHYRCVLSLIFPDGREITSESLIPGEVLYERRGNAGFGYDPVIRLNHIGKTLAEVDFSVTVKDGFRPIAARKLFAAMR